MFVYQLGDSFKGKLLHALKGFPRKHDEDLLFDEKLQQVDISVILTPYFLIVKTRSKQSQ